MPRVLKILFLINIIFFFSCANRKKMIYFQGDKEIRTDTSSKFSTKLKSDDLLSITVMGLDAEAVKPFNLATYGQTNGSKMVAGSATGVVGFLIDRGGEIEFPVVGKVKLSGLNRSEASDLIKNKLKDYVKDPIVNIQILNFKITILGDVNKPGIYTIPYERITLVDAIGLAGDLSLTGLRKNILVIRDIDGRKTETRVDLTSKEVFNSPVFYLQQNDVIYVEQNRAKKNSAAVSASIGVVLSITTLVITLATFLLVK